MKRGLLGVSLIILIAGAAGLLLAGSETEQKKSLTLEVTSTLTGEEVEFEGALVFQAEEDRCFLVRERTPFEYTGDAGFVSAMFQGTSSNTHLHVELIRREKGREKVLVSGTGESIILGHNILKKKQSFIRVF